jgi:hyperosmotically inducible periplasmic protein
VLFAVLFVAVGFLMSWWGPRVTVNLPNPVGTTGVNSERAREVGAQIGEKTAVAVDKAAQVAGDARRAIENSGITAKIKAKMALDDTVKALDVEVTTHGSVVTVSGVVRSDAEHQKAIQLAKDTAGVTEVVDKIQVRRIQ